MEKARAHAISILIFISILLLLLVGGRAIILWQIDNTITTKINDLKRTGIEIEFSNKKVKLWNKSLQFENVHIKSNPPHSLASSTVSIPNILIANISLIPLIAKKEIIIKKILLTKPEAFIFYTTSDSTHPITKKLPKFTIKIADLKIDSLSAQFIDKVNSTVNGKVRLSLSIKDLDLFTTDSINWTAGVVTLNNIGIELPTSFYQIKTKQLTFTSTKKMLQLDSVELLPTPSNLEFARKNTYQIDRITARIPVLTVKGFDPGETFQPRFIASAVAFNFSLAVYHDKRFPMAKKKQMVLPPVFIRQFGFPLHVATVKIGSSFISYDEFPEAGEKAGRIFFNDLKATISNISSANLGETRMDVESRFMDAGKLTATFTFPLALHMPYTVKGKLQNFSLSSINQMLTPLEHLSITQGNLKAMDFHFHYNEQKATGALVLDYSNLRVSILKKKNPNQVNVLASIVANAILKNTMDNTILEKKRTGAIQFDRDPTEGIFGFWWKSLRDGIKSVYTVEKITSRNHKKKVRGK
jgi:hypothetical protein